MEATSFCIEELITFFDIKRQEVLHHHGKWNDQSESCYSFYIK